MPVYVVPAILIGRSRYRIGVPLSNVGVPGGAGSKPKKMWLCNRLRYRSMLKCPSLPNNFSYPTSKPSAVSELTFGLPADAAHAGSVCGHPEKRLALKWLVLRNACRSERRGAAKPVPTEARTTVLLSGLFTIPTRGSNLFTFSVL